MYMAALLFPLMSPVFKKENKDTLNSEEKIDQI